MEYSHGEKKSILGTAFGLFLWQTKMREKKDLIPALPGSNRVNGVQDLIRKSIRLGYCGILSPRYLG